MIFLIAADPAEPDDYAAAARLIGGLRTDLAAAQQTRNLTASAMAAQIGIRPTTLSRLLSGDTTDPASSTVRACWRWLAAP